MSEKRFVDDGFEAIDEQSFTDTETDKTYYVDYFDEIIDLCNELNDENKKLKSLCKVLITHIEKKSIAFMVDEDIRRLLE